MTTSIRFQNALFPAILDVLSASRKLRLGPGFGNRLPEYNHSAYFSLKPLKGLVQKYRGSAEKFENRLLGPTNTRLLPPISGIAAFRPRAILPPLNRAEDEDGAQPAS